MFFDDFVRPGGSKSGSGTRSTASPGSWGGPGRVLGRSWEGLGGPRGCWEGPGTVLGWSWEGPRRVLEASSRDLGGQTEPNRAEKWQSCVQRRTYYLQKQNADTKTGTVAGLAAGNWINKILGSPARMFLASSGHSGLSPWPAHIYLLR